MPFDGFMWIELPSISDLKVEGETIDKGYKQQKAFEIKSFSVDCENPNSIGSAGGGAGTGKVKLNAFKVTKATDNCSPTMFSACCQGCHYKKACIVVRKAGQAVKGSGAGIEYLKFTFTVVFVTNIEWSGDSGDELPTETVQFAYGAMKMQYWPQTGGGGRGTVLEQVWNQVTNSADENVPDPA